MYPKIRYFVPKEMFFHNNISGQGSYSDGTFSAISKPTVRNRVYLKKNDLHLDMTSKDMAMFKFKVNNE